MSLILSELALLENIQELMYNTLTHNHVITRNFRPDFRTQLGFLAYGCVVPARRGLVCGLQTDSARGGRASVAAADRASGPSGECGQAFTSTRESADSAVGAGLRIAAMAARSPRGVA